MQACKTGSVRQTVPDIDHSTAEEIYSAFATSTWGHVEHTKMA